MHATLAAFLRMSPAERNSVTVLDLSIVSDEDLYRLPPDAPVVDGLGVGSPWRRDTEEWPGESGYTYPQPRMERKI